MPEKEKGKAENETWVTGKSRYLFGSCEGSKKTVYQFVSIGSCTSVNLASDRVSKAMLLENVARVQPEMWTEDGSGVT